MTINLSQARKCFFKAVCLVVGACVLATSLLPSLAYAQVWGASPASPKVLLSPAFHPALVRGIRFYPNDPFTFDFIVDSGNAGLAGDMLQSESEKLLRYFLAALAIPDDQVWVNLSPYEQDRIIPDVLGLTEMGYDMLAQDYLLKQVTASLTNPDSDLGKQFWSKIYQQSYEKFGTTNVSINTFNKVWILPDYAEIYENGSQALITDSRLKVMLEEDYLAKEKKFIEFIEFAGFIELD